MESKNEITRYMTLPTTLIGTGSFFGILGWWGLAQAAGSILLFSGSMLLSLSGSIATLVGLLTLEKTKPNKQKVRKIKSLIANDIKIQYPNYILQVEYMKQQHQTLYDKMSAIWEYSESFKLNVLQLKTQLEELQRNLQENLKRNTPEWKDDSVDDIAQKILWSEKEIELSEYQESLNTLSNYLTTSDLDGFRDELYHISRSLKQLENGIAYYRDLLLFCSQEEEDNYDQILDVKEKVEKTDTLISQQNTRLVELGNKMNTKHEQAEIELTNFQSQLSDFEKIND